jgi:DNA-binding response OmpR family regulator
MRILIVDDEAPNRAILARLLESRGHRTEGVESAEAALVRASQERYGLILLDLSLPGRTGLEALADLRRAGAGAIALMTGQDDEDTRKDALLLGADEFLPKPVDAAALFALIARFESRPG